MIKLEDYIAKLPVEEQKKIETRSQELRREMIAIHIGMKIKVWPEDESFAPLYVRNMSDVTMVMGEFPCHKMLYEKFYN